MADKPYRYEKEGKSPYLLIGLLLILIVIVGWGLISIISQRATPPPAAPNVTPPLVPPPPPPPPTNVTPACDDNCLLSRAVSSGNHTACAQISNETVEQECYYQLSDDSLESCRLLTDSARKDACLRAFASANKDISLCDLLSSGKDQCRLSVDPCYGSQNLTLCLALASSNPGKCNLDSACLMNYSMTKKDASSCSLIQNTVVEAACESSVLNSDRCSLLGKPAERDLCYQIFAIQTDYLYTCTQITPNTNYSIECYSTFAIREQNYSVCDVFSLDERWACYRIYALNTADLSSCDAIDALATTNKFLCVFDTAKKYGDPSACVHLAHLGQRDTCYEGTILYAEGNLDWTKCDGVPTPEWRNKCYNEAAKIYDDIGLCDYLIEDYAHEACIIAYNNYKSQQGS